MSRKMASTASAANKTYNWNPWKVEQVHPSDLIVDKFQSWDKTQDPKPRQKAWNRARKWVSDLIRLAYDPPSGQGLRVVDKDNALKFLIENMHEGKTTFENFLCMCMKPPKATASYSSTTSPVITETVEITETNSEEDTEVNSTDSIEVVSVHEGNKLFKCESCDYTCGVENDMYQHVTSVHEGKKPLKCQSCDYTCDLTSGMQQHVASVHEGKKTGKICKSTWLGIECQIISCVNVHIKPCSDRECLALDGGLPLYKARNCPLWHVRPKLKPKKHKIGKNPNPGWPRNDQNQKLRQRHRDAPQTQRNTQGERPSLATGFHPKRSYRDIVRGHTGQSGPSPWIEPSVQGNALAAAVTQPPIRRGNSNPMWGQNSNQFPVQFISEICQQVIKSLSSMNTMI